MKRLNNGEKGEKRVERGVKTLLETYAEVTTLTSSYLPVEQQDRLRGLVGYNASIVFNRCRVQVLII